ncbi:MAG: DUF4961 domain-containing protein [Alistipes sp.]|jgi:hypothetical protein|nr:DUF4961 domain-containing protein [Alistipes sp.]
MKFLKNYRFWLATLVLPFTVVTCMTIEDIIHPDDAQVDSEITIQVKLKFVSETDRQSKLAFGILAPKSWNIANNATLTLNTTAQYAPSQVTDEPMTVIPAAQLNPSTGTPWAASFQSRFGLLGNYGPMEWVVFESQTDFLVHDTADDGKQKEIDGVVTIKLTTGPDNMKVNMGYAYCGKTYGFTADEYPEDRDVVASKVLEVSGGAGPVVDFTTVSLISTTPQAFGYGDIFAINFVEETESTTTPLKGADKVYLWGKVVYDGGEEKVVDAIDAKTLMEKIGDGAWQRYIYPRDFFDLPAGAVITATYFHFSDESGSIVVRNNDDEDFMIVESAE